jgi:hypothetical protein
MCQGYARRAAEESMDPGQGFTVDLAIKDVRCGCGWHGLEDGLQSHDMMSVCTY